jgi:lipopolysaccharide export system protein LptA
VERLIKNSIQHVPIKALALLMLGLFVCSQKLYAQEKKKIVIRHANNQEYKKENGNDLFWLVGDVEYDHEGATMKCDSSIYYRNENRFSAFGNVAINQGDTLFMYGDQLEYDGTGKLLHIMGNVRMRDKKMNLTSNEIIYDRKNNLAYYNSGGQLQQEDNLLRSRRGFYNTLTRRFTFKDSVFLFSPKYTIEADTLQYGSTNKVAYFLGPTYICSDSTTIYCENGQYDTQNDIAYLTENAVITKSAQTIKGDSIYYDLKGGEGELFGNAYLSDTISKYVIRGGFARYSEDPEFALVTQQPVYALDIDSDTLFIGGDTLRIVSNEFDQRKVRVFRNTRFFKSDFQGKCDSLIYTEEDSTFQLYVDPVVWNQNNQLTADYIFMTTRNGNMDSLHMIDNAFLIALEDSNKYNQIKGRNMYGKFFDNELRLIYVNGNGQTVYYAYDDEDKEVGVNRADCSNLLIKIMESKVSRVTFITKPDAVLYPPGEIPKAELFLRGFNPRYAEQLTDKSDLFD